MTKKEKILKEIGKAWQDTRKHFGDTFPFEEELNFKIIDKKKEFPGKIIFEPKIK